MNNKIYTGKEIEEIIGSMTIIIDSREQINSHIKLWLKSKEIPYIIQKLDFGDYSFFITKNEQLNISEDKYFNNEIAIERKANLEEISNNFTQGRDRFKREFEKGNDKIRLLIEDSSYNKLCKGEYNTKLNSNSFKASLHSFQENYNVPFFFCDKECSAEYIYNTFKYYLRNKLKPNV